MSKDAKVALLTLCFFIGFALAALNIVAKIRFLGMVTE